MPSLPVWKLVRNPYGRAVYDALDSVGVKFSKMHLYVADLSDAPEVDPPGGVIFEIRSPDEITPPPSQDEEPLAADDNIIIALRNKNTTESNDKEVVGYQTLSLDRPVYVPPVEREMDHEAYLWGLYVDPDYRNRGIATTLISEALRVAHEYGAESAHSLVAVDNAPSQRALAANGFEPRREVSYYRLFGLERRVDRPL